MVDYAFVASKPLGRLGVAARVVLIPLALGLGACDGDSGTAPDAPENTTSTTGGASPGPTGGRPGSGGAMAQGGSPTTTGGGGNVGPTGGSSVAGGPAATAGMDFAVPGRGQVLSAQQLADQLAAYDPGSLLRCDVVEDAAYKTAIDALGGVTWGYNVGVLEDQSKPRYLAGVPRPMLDVAAPNAGADGRAVEIAVADVVAVTETAALFYSTSHGLMIVGVDGDKPAFHCAAPLPGRVSEFYFHQDHLVVMTKSQNNQSSQLLHFTVAGTELRFVENLDLGNVNVLDSRRFNEKLVFYTSFSTAPPPAPATPGAAPAPVQVVPQQNHRALRVYRLGDKLEEELYDTLIDTSEPEQRLAYELPRDTAPGTQLSESQTFGGSMWASDHYFVVTEAITKTFLKEWVNATYSVCTASHTTETSYQYCWTEFETQPNPDYVEPDNSGGDRACKGTTLSDCLVQVAKVSNKTIQVPVGRKCEERTRTNWFCDAREQRSVEYPTFQHDVSTRLFIYEYTDSGFVRLDSKVHEVTNQGLTGVAPDATVDVITTSPESFDLAVPGAIQTLYFQNGYLYVISKGVLQVYAMGGSSIVRTATLPVVNETLQSSLFSSDRLFLSDFGWSSGADHSTLRVVDLANPAFPALQAATHQLPGGHRSILAAEAGIFTIGRVQNFMGQNVNALKLGLFSDPYAEETAYLILGTDLKNTWLAAEEAQFFNASSQRLLLPYSGSDETQQPVLRVGVSRVEPGSIESEGAVVLPEAAQRVRPLPTDQESYLTFATNSIEWLTPNQGEWKSEPVLEYLEPIALYRRTKDSEYVELQRLGRRCRLYFAADAINQRADGEYSEEFACTGGYPQAYDHRLLLDLTSGIEFGDDHSIRPLSATEVEETRDLIAAREYCLLKLEFVDAPWLDPKEDLPPLDQFTCLSPQEFVELQNQLSTP